MSNSWRHRCRGLLPRSMKSLNATRSDCCVFCSPGQRTGQMLRTRFRDTFISAHRYLYSFNPRWRFSTWLYRIALRNIARQPWRYSQDAEIEPTASEDPLQICLVASDRENVWLTAKQHLSDDAYSAMWLRYVEDMSVREVARSLNKSVSWAKVTLMRGRRRLKLELADSASATAQSESYG